MASSGPGPGPSQLAALEERARGGDETALAELLRAQEPALLRLVSLRLHPGLRGRLDPVDVVQEAAVEALRRFAEWRRQAALPLSLWVRLVARQALAQAHRRHLGADMRDALREARPAPSVSAVSAADALVGDATSPSSAAARDELRGRVLAALEALDELDREIVVLRHYEGLSNEEAAAELAIAPAAASKRFVRALVRLRPALVALASEGAAPRP
jgi:RNA polymerase sigma-70 factor (ECF subfamily)